MKKIAIITVIIISVFLIICISTIFKSFNYFLMNPYDKCEYQLDKNSEYFNRLMELIPPDNIDFDCITIYETDFTYADGTQEIIVQDSDGVSNVKLEGKTLEIIEKFFEEVDGCYVIEVYATGNYCFTMGGNLDDGYGIAYVPSGSKEDLDIQFLDEFKPLSLDNWFYYCTDYNRLRYVGHGTVLCPG